MWFLAAHFMDVPRADNESAAASLASVRYETAAACYDGARDRLSALSAIGLHGRYMCMRHGESGRDMARAPKRSF